MTVKITHKFFVIERGPNGYVYLFESGDDLERMKQVAEDRAKYTNVPGYRWVVEDQKGERLWPA